MELKTKSAKAQLQQLNKQRPKTQTRGAVRDLSQIFAKVKCGDASFEAADPKSR